MKHSVFTGALALALSTVLLIAQPGRTLAADAEQQPVSLASLLLAPFAADKVRITDDLWADVTTYFSQLPPNEERMLLRVTSIVGGPLKAKIEQKNLEVPNIAKGLILKWIAELHGASMRFDGRSIVLQALQRTESSSSRWYSVSGTLVEAFLGERPSQKVQRSSDGQPTDLTTSVVESVQSNSAKLFEELNIRDISITGGRIELSGPESTLDALDRWLTVQFWKISAADNATRTKMSGPSDNEKGAKPKTRSKGKSD